MIRPLPLPLAALAALALLLAPAAAPAAPAAPVTAAAGTIAGDAAACAAGAPAIQATIVGLKDRQGDLKLELYPATDADFLRDDRDLIAEGKVFRRVRVAAPASGAVALCIRVPRPGRYGLLFTHNRDGKNKFSIWNDGAGIVSNARLGRGRPRVAESTVEVGNAVTMVTIRAQYLHGLGGFSPAG